jgi:hypothetical protein
MSPEEAKLELDATTLRPEDASEEVRAMVSEDPALARWADRRTRFDTAVSEAFSRMEVPLDLRESILAAKAGAGSRSLRPAWVKSAFLLAAACLAVGFFALQFVQGKVPAWQSESLAAVMAIDDGSALLDEAKDDLDEIRRLLTASGSVAPQHIPATVAALQALGCKRVQIGKEPATVICFMLESGHEAHLLVMNSARPDLGNQPQFSSDKGWSMATWSDGQQTFFLATSDNSAVLRRLLGHS